MKKMILVLTSCITLFSLAGCLETSTTDDNDTTNPDTQNPDTQTPGGDNNNDNGIEENDEEGFSTIEEATQFILESTISGTFFNETTSQEYEKFLTEDAYNKLNASRSLSKITGDVKKEFETLESISAIYGTYTSYTSTSEVTQDEKDSIIDDGAMFDYNNTPSYIKFTLEYTNEEITNELDVIMLINYNYTSSVFTVGGIKVLPVLSEAAVERLQAAERFVSVELTTKFIQGTGNFDIGLFAKESDKNTFDAILIGVENTKHTVEHGDIKLINESDAIVNGEDFIYELSFNRNPELGIFYTGSLSRDFNDYKEDAIIKITIGEDEHNEMIVKSLDINEDQIVEYYLSEKIDYTSTFNYGENSIPQFILDLRTMLGEYKDLSVDKDKLLSDYCNSYIKGNSNYSVTDPICGNLVDFSNNIGSITPDNVLVNYDYTVNQTVVVTFESSYTFVLEKDIAGKYMIIDYVSPNYSDVLNGLDKYKHDLQTKKDNGSLTFTDIVNAIINPVK